MPFRKFAHKNDSFQLTERREYAPSDPMRARMLAIIPADKKGTAFWTHENGRTLLATCLPENVTNPAMWEKRHFPTKELYSQMVRVVGQNIPAGRQIEASWEIPQAEGQSDGTAVWTLVTKMVADANAPVAARNDGLENKSLADLQTIIGIEGVRGPDGKIFSYANMEPPELIDHIRAHRIAKKKPKKESRVEIPAA